MIGRHAVWVLNIFVVMAGGLLADPSACLALESRLQARALEIFGEDQGIYFVSEVGSPLVAIEPDRPLIPASLSKIPATTAILGRLDPDHRFRTRVIYRGGSAASTATRPGDLVVEASGDPFLVSESLLWIGSRGRLTGAFALASRTGRSPEIRARSPSRPATHLRIIELVVPDPRARGKARGRTRAHPAQPERETNLSAATDIQQLADIAQRPVMVFRRSLHQRVAQILGRHADRLTDIGKRIGPVPVR